MSEGEHPHITAESQRFADELVAMEPGTEIAGIYVNKPGFHGTRKENQARDEQDGDVNYSVEHPLDLQGPDDKAAAYDWTHWAAQSGDYRSMAKYGDRLEAAFLDRDPRLYGWHEAQGQTDTDKAPEELNFDDWTRGVPSDSHAWHWHFSEHRAFADDWDNKECMLSILRGETLASYLARGGRLMNEESDMSEWSKPDPYGVDPDGYDDRTPGMQLRDLYAAVFFGQRPLTTDGSPVGPEPWITAQIDALHKGMAAILEALKGGVTLPAKVDLSDEALDAVEARVRDAEADGLEAGAAAVRAES